MNSYAFSTLEYAHEKSHAQIALVRKTTNDKARENRAIAREYHRQKT